MVAVDTWTFFILRSKFLKELLQSVVDSIKDSLDNDM